MACSLQQAVSTNWFPVAFCSGFVMAAVVPQDEPEPDREPLSHGSCNLCRCATTTRV